jgi:hypothetical protein
MEVSGRREYTREHVPAAGRGVSGADPRLVRLASDVSRGLGMAVVAAAFFAEAL